MGGTCAICGRAFIRQVRVSAGRSWSCPYCHVQQAGPARLDELARQEAVKHYLEAHRARAQRAERKGEELIQERIRARKAARG
jgi:ribosomal protein L37AE/L43A